LRIPGISSVSFLCVVGSAIPPHHATPQRVMAGEITNLRISATIAIVPITAQSRPGKPIKAFVDVTLPARRARRPNIELVY
jgi:hypothetical protein